MTFDDASVRDVLAGLPIRIGHVFRPYAEHTPGQPALVSPEGRLTYGELAELVSGTARSLLSLGVRPGDRMTIIGENCLSLAVLVLAASEIDAWSVVVHPRLAAREIDQILDHSNSRIAFYDARPAAMAEMHARRHGAKAPGLGELKPIVVGDLRRDAKPEPTHSSSDRQVATLIYTSGTTGLPKGVMLSHRNLLFGAASVVENRMMTAADHVYGMTAIAHISGFTLGLIASLSVGATLFLPPRFDPAAMMDSMSHDGITMATGTPTMFRQLLEYMTQNAIDRRTPGKLRFLGVVGAPLDIALKREVEERLKVPLINGYGLTETSPGIASVNLSAPRDDTSVGFVLPGIESRILDRNGKEVSPGEVGELHVRGPNVMLGYYRNREETAAALDADGWFNTGDLVRTATDGALFIVGRTKDIIIHMALNIYPAEVEAVLDSHPDVVESAVIGRRSHQDQDEEVVAFVKLVPNSRTTGEDLIAYCSRELADYKLPSAIHIVDAMPLNASGKIAKNQLAALIASPSPVASDPPKR